MLVETPSHLRPQRDRRHELLNQIAWEFEHTPRLALSAAQARRLWTLEAGTCEQLLGCLVDEGLLRKRADGMYVLLAREA